MQAQRYGYTQMIKQRDPDELVNKLRFAQDLTLYLGDLGLDIEGFDLDAGKKHWLETHLAGHALLDRDDDGRRGAACRSST